jgi:elongation factor Ts
VLVDQAKATGKPEAAIEKMVEGRIRKYYEEVVLMEQPFVMDGKVKVNELVKQAAKEMDAAVEVTGFIRFALGDGVKKEEEE